MANIKEIYETLTPPTKRGELKNIKGMDTTEGNKIIREYDGWRFMKWCGIYKDMPLFQKFNKEGTCIHDGIFHEPDYMKWETLMPVVEKIIQMTDVDFDAHNWLVKIATNISSTKSWQVTSFTYLKQKDATMIGAYYFCVIEFIQWYNKNKTTQP